MLELALAIVIVLLLLTNAISINTVLYKKLDAILQRTQSVIVLWNNAERSKALAKYDMGNSLK